MFLGLASCYRRFVPGFAQITRPLTTLLKKGQEFKWGINQERSFRELQERLISVPILAYPDFTKPFILQTDASDFAIGGVLSQINDIGDEHPVTYVSRTLQAAEINYSVVTSKDASSRYRLITRR